MGYKSFLYQHSVRAATSQRQKLRSFDEVHMADSGLMEQACIYVTSQNAAIRLYDPQNAVDSGELSDLLTRYKPLVKADLKANTALIEHATRGLSKVHLPWFWTLDVEGDLEGNQWMDESKSVSYIPVLAVNYCRSVSCSVAASSCS